jgi:hypothetical protein
MLRIGSEARTLCDATTSRAPSVSTTKTNMLIKNPRIMPPSFLAETPDQYIDARDGAEDSPVVRLFANPPGASPRRKDGG